LAEKYRIEFKSREGHNCVVRFDFASFSGLSTTLIGADRPFVLGEYNTDEDWFKPTRPLEATINILTNVSGVSMESFLVDDDAGITVYFDFGTWGNYWIGWVLQDNFQEVWQDTYHVLTIKASDGIGKLADVPLTDNSGNELIGTFTPYQFIQYAMYKTPQTFINSRIINNLFNTTMTSTANNMPLDQCYLDAKTFQKQVAEYDDSLTTLNKINTAFNQTIFFYKNRWHIVRLEELYASTLTNLVGFTNSLAGRTSFTKRFDAEVSATSPIKQISAEMLRYIVRKTKKDTINFNYNEFNEVLCNESFSRGALTSSSSSLIQFQLDQWLREYGSIGSPTNAATGFGRNEEYDTNGQLNDNYAYVDSQLSTLCWLRSCSINVLASEKFKLSFEHKYQVGFSGTAVQPVAIVMFFGTTNNYTLDDDGSWNLSNATFTTNIKELQIYYNGTTGLIPTDYQTLSIDAAPFPQNGYINLLLLAPDSTLAGTNSKRFNSLKVDIVNPFNGYNSKSITGIQSIFTKSIDVRNNFEDEIFADDAFSRIYKGTLLRSDQITPTAKTWFRDRFNTESYGFRRQNDTAHWEHNRFNRNKIDCNFFGLTWDDGGTTEPIGLINTIVFPTDDARKVYGILNLKEIDFSNSTWSATLIELFDEDKDQDGGTVTKYLEVNTTLGTFNALVYAKLSIVTPADFTLNSNLDQLTFNGLASITVPINASITGYINSNSSSPVTITLRKNSTIIATQSFTIASNPYPFSANLNVASVTLAPGDLLYIQYSANITQILVNGGSIELNYTTSNPFTYSPYQDKFIYQ
jgi:hypothetical protein